MSVRIITDSACDMSGAEHPALTVLPIAVIFGDTVYQDGVDLSHDRFYELLVAGDGLPGTGQINPFAYSEAIAAAAEAGEDVVIVTLSSKLSGTYHNACAAAEESGSEVHVVDSLNATVGQHILVEYALRLVDEGRTAAQIADELERARERVVLVALLDTLEYLRRSGRISNAVGAVGTMLNIKPLVTVDDGAVAMLGRARGLKAGRKQVVSAIEEAGVDLSMPVEFGYSGCDDACVRKFMDETLGIWGASDADELSMHSVGATIGTHVGPGAFAVAFFKKA